MSGNSRLYAHGVDQVIDEMRQEFLDEAGDTLRSLELMIENVRHEKVTMEDLVKQVLRDTRVLQAQGNTLDMHLIAMVASRMEDYLANAKTYSPHIFEHLQTFTETLMGILEGDIPADADAAQVVRSLPAKATFDLGDIDIRNVEVMLVMHHDAAAHFVERELQQCGYRTSVISRSLKALPMILRTKPDLVIASAMLPELDGLDLAIGMAAMPATRNIPIAIITSLDPGDEHLKLLPDKVPRIFKGASFGDDLANALDMLFLL